MDIKYFQQNSYLADGNFTYIEALYDEYLKDPHSVSEYWRNYFTQMATQNNPGVIDVPLTDIRQHFLKIANSAQMTLPAVSTDLVQERLQVKINQLIQAYRSYGHQQAKLDPLDLAVRKNIPDLQLTQYDLTEADFSKVIPGVQIGHSGETIGAIYQALNHTYSNRIGIEFMHITNHAETRWIQQRVEAIQGHPEFSETQKLRILSKLTAAEGIEKYLGSRYVGQKRFSLEGAISLIPMLDELVQRAGTEGVKEIIIGMAHRGRLNVLVNILGKEPEALFEEFEGKKPKTDFSGDVKYHMGFSSNVKTPGGILHLAMAFNPSHLEIIDPVIEGSVRARQDRRNDSHRNEVIPVLIHGDAALAGQGVVAETLNFSQSRGFCTGGTLHIVVNNQIGFTTSNPLDARSTLYCTDVAKMVQAPVIHVNGDAPEACVFALELALDYRMRFKKDVMVDLVCYRRHGHNEADEPSATQPIMYDKIKSLPRTREIYIQQLIEEGIINEEQGDKMMDDYRDALDKKETIVPQVPKEQADPQLANWKPYKNQKWDQPVNTEVALDKLRYLGERLTTLPENFHLQTQVAREYQGRREMIQENKPFNWGFAETLAYATLVTEGFPVRLCGQDSARGTFSHRHSILHDQETGDTYIPLQNLEDKQKSMTIIDSILSEEGVLGFEYGYATTEPETLVIWEAQFGDFANGAQVVIDQFISSGEQKWGRLCGLVMFLPHGYEGQGPEHSSARLERYLQLCAQHNIQVCVPTTPAQIFHLLRRQMIRPYRKPLIVITPKSLLRHKLATSSLTHLAQGEFQVVIPEIDDDINTKAVRRIIFCSGKVYYDLLAQRRDKKIKDIAIIRIEQLYPWPEEHLRKTLTEFPKVKEIFWCQEEPENQGAWLYLRHNFNQLISSISPEITLTYAGRESQASPATGYTWLHLQQQEALVMHALDLKNE